MSNLDENDTYFYGIAQIAEQAAEGKGLTNIDARWIFCQMKHESANFSSELMGSNHNLAGLTQEEQNSTPQPDGTCYYMNFDTFEAYGDYFGRYLRYYIENGIDKATTLAEYVTALKNGGYFGDDLDAYISDCEAIYNECFGE